MSPRTRTRRTHGASVIGVAVLAFVLLALAPAFARSPVRRFALVVGNDLGGEGTSPLLYAREDARRMRDVLVRLGGVQPDDAVVVLGRGVDAVLAALTDIESRMRAARAGGAETTFVFYYSGHAKDGDLQLGRTRLPLEALKARIGNSPAQLRIAVIDSCRSGAVTRSKGARRAPAFDIETSAGDSARGTVFLTSSSFDEDSQESDHIGGSYFSHHLVSGLQGQADRSGDGRVTLAEAYAYTYARTVADTASSTAGAQHPTFSYDLKGSGDFVLSMYAESREGLHLPASTPAGTYFLVDGRGVVAAEIVKQDGRDRRVAVRSGRYTVKRRMPDRLRIGTVDIPRNQVVSLDETRLRDAPFSDDPIKGAYRDLPSHISVNLGAGSQNFFAAPEGEGLFPDAGLVGIELVVADFLRRDWLLGFDLAAGGGDGAVDRYAVAVPFRMNQLSLGASLMAEWPFLDGDLAPFVGARLAFLLLTRQFQEEVLPEQYFSTFSPGLVAGLRYRLGNHWMAVARTRLHYLHYNVDEDRSLGFWELALALGYNF